MKLPNKLFQFWNEEVCEVVAIICCLFMIAGLFFSRALLSMSMLVMFFNALHPASIKQNFLMWKRDAFSLLCLAFFGAYLFSGLWSNNTNFWLSATLNKLPFVVLPFAFISVPLKKEKVQRILIMGLALMQMIVIVYSIFRISSNWSYYVQGYNFSRPIPTTKYNDHIRFSLSLVLSVFLMIYLIIEEHRNGLSSLLKWLLIATIIVFVAYIHILAAKTGIVCLYLAALMFVISKIGRTHKLLAFCLILGIAGLPLLGYKFVPTFKMKVGYVLYEISETKNNHHYDYTLSDAGRMITYEIGGNEILKHPMTGVGAGDVMDVMNEGYEKSYPEVNIDQRFGPINQFMFTALSVGIPLTFILLALCLTPLFLKVKSKIYLLIASIILFISLMVESPLELQFGVFTYLFFILIWIGMLRQQPLAKNKL
jgi:O-antigen ligase